jgi:hypothetical protein
MYRFSHVRPFLFGLITLPLLVVLVGLSWPTDRQAEHSDRPCTECCTSLLVGPGASVDGSTMTSHSCDSGTDRTWIALEPRKSHESGSMATLWMQPKRTTRPNDPDRIPVGEIPQVAETFKFMDSAYPIMNEHQLAIGETTTGGKGELRSTEGLIDAPELYRLVLGNGLPTPGRPSGSPMNSPRSSDTTTGVSASPSPTPRRSGSSRSWDRGGERSALSGPRFAYPTTISPSAPIPTGSWS